tara:strand:- start:183 stop:1280 length:1098 start_codon:yes stop_codon:yes gene_type:complete
MAKTELNIIGGGCAALSLAGLSKSLNGYKINLYVGNQNKKINDHFWGFWKNKSTEIAFDISDYSWSHWSIITYESKQILSSNTYPYCVIRRSKWLDYCLSQINNKRVNIVQEDALVRNNDLFVYNNKIEGKYIFDSRQPKIPSNILLQHFEGYIITSEKNIFDDKTVTLMDFRCDQSKGMHFIYLLPLNKNSALVESTIFSKNIEKPSFYLNAIKLYLRKYYNLTKFVKSHHEKGIIPMHDITVNSKFTYNIGTRGGAVRPSSGYAFTFIQKQVFQIKSQLISKGKIKTNVHKKLDLFLDRIFIKVIELNPQIAPKIFSDLAKGINGDEMAMFMSGDCSFFTKFKIIKSMPKIPFMMAFLKIVKE